MKNVAKEKPTGELHGRPLFNTRFIDNKDIEGKEILDIGCGFGWMELNAVERGAKSIVGIEVTETDLETARNNISDPRISFRTGSAIELPFKKESFDTVVSWEVIEHIPENTEMKMFSEVNKVLRPGGIFYLSTPYDSFFSKVFDPAWWLIKHRHYSKRQMAKFAAKNGFEVEQVNTKGGWWEIISVNNFYIAKWLFRRKIFFQEYLDKKQDVDFPRDNGFTHIFAKFRKI